MPVFDIFFFCRHLDEKEINLQESLQRIQILERELAAKDAEVDLFPSPHYSLMIFCFKLNDFVKQFQQLRFVFVLCLKQIVQCQSHISELNLHAEAQACEYKQKVGQKTLLMILV